MGKEEFKEAVDSSLGTSAEIHGIAASSDVLHTLGVGCTWLLLSRHHNFVCLLGNIANTALKNVRKTRVHKKMKTHTEHQGSRTCLLV